MRLLLHLPSRLYIPVCLSATPLQHTQTPSRAGLSRVALRAFRAATVALLRNVRALQKGLRPGRAPQVYKCA